VNPICHKCGAAPHTLQHWLQECPTTAEQRQRLLGAYNWPATLRPRVGATRDDPVCTGSSAVTRTSHKQQWRRRRRRRSTHTKRLTTRPSPTGQTAKWTLPYKPYKLAAYHSILDPSAGALWHRYNLAPQTLEHWPTPQQTNHYAFSHQPTRHFSVLLYIWAASGDLARGGTGHTCSSSSSSSSIRTVFMVWHFGTVCAGR